VDLIVGNGQMLYAARDSDELAGSQVNVAVPELDEQPALCPIS
jgi:hypothetical protein